MATKPSNISNSQLSAVANISSSASGTLTNQVLTSAIVKTAAKVSKDPIQARDFLIRAGIITKSGKLTSKYK